MATETDRTAAGARGTPGTPSREGRPATPSSAPSAASGGVPRGRALALRGSAKRPRAARVTARGSGSDVRRPLGQLCPCGLEPATVELRVGPVYTKVGARCFASTLHIVKVLGKILS